MDSVMKELIGQCPPECFWLEPPLVYFYFAVFELAKLADVTVLFWRYFCQFSFTIFECVIPDITYKFCPVVDIGNLA